ncbi:MAG: amidohydrolase family protein [Clostridiales bacterium]|nr:amidohydrolase family protein [Clostridiales bacterium]
MSTLLIKNAGVITKDSILEKYSVYCADGKIEKVLPVIAEDSFTADETVDASGMHLSPGFIDLHVHGTRNYLIDRGREHLEAMCRILPQYGVTGFLPSVCPAPTEADDLKLLASFSQVKSEGTSILGFFLEGHFLALTGALPVIPKNRSMERVEKLIEALKPYKAVFGISPEVEGIVQLLPLMTKQGYPAFITHTAATVEQTENAIKAGALHATHFYDVFPYPGEKDPGVRACGTVEAILTSPETSVDFILDGEHVDPVAVKMALACKGREKVCLITDANINAGLPPGSYKAFESDIDVFYEGGPARMSRNSRFPGALTGSGLTMDRAVRNAVKLLGVDIPQSIAMASSSPAQVLGLQNRKGFIKEGYDADMVLLDRELNVVKCWVGGRCCFCR